MDGFSTASLGGNWKRASPTSFRASRQCEFWHSGGGECSLTRIDGETAKARSILEPDLISGEMVGVCVLVRWLLDDFFLHKFFSAVFLYPAIILAAYWCGARPALLAIGLSCQSIRYFFMRPPGQLRIVRSTALRPA